MNDVDDAAPPGAVNPYSAMAVARVTDGDADPVTIETGAVKTTRSLLHDYLQPSGGQADQTGRRGFVVAIVGDYGTGKTHLAMDLLRQARQTAGVVTHPMYLEAPADTFEALYRAFVQNLDRNDVVETIRDYYADVVAGALEGSELTADVARRLRARELDPAGVVHGLGLMDSLLSRQLRQELSEVTEDEQFGVALTLLLLRPDLHNAVWDWLKGGFPAAALADRGITEAISGEETVLEAMAVFAHLYSHRDHRFVLFIDELDKVLAADEPPGEAAISAFKTMLVVFEAAGAFLAISGLPDLLDALGKNVQQRLGQVVTMSAFTGDDVCRFIAQTHQRELGTSRMAPFTESIAEYIGRIADGTPRRVVRLCYHLYRRAEQERVPVITGEMVSDVARAQFDFPTLDNVRSDVRRVLTNAGMPYEHDYLPGRRREDPVDFWIPVGSRGAGIAVLIVDSVLTEPEGQRLSQRVADIRAAVNDSEAVLVVVGHLVPALRPELETAFRGEPVEYGRRSFVDDLRGALANRVATIESLSGDDPLAVVLERLERMTRQQSHTQSFVERLVGRVDVIRASSERQMEVIRRDLDALARSTAGAGVPPPPAVPARVGVVRMPPDVVHLFGDALVALDELVRLDAMLRHAFAADPPHPAAEVRLGIRASLRTRELYSAVGAAAFLRALVEAFRDGVDDWYRSAGPDPHGRLHPDDEKRLIALCYTYDAIYESLPVSTLDELAGLSVGRPGHQDEVEQVSWEARRTGTKELFGRLGADVRKEVLRSVTRHDAG